MAKLFRTGGPPSGEAVQIEPTADGLRIRGADDLEFTFPYAPVQHRLGGYENAWLILTSDGVPGAELWMLPEDAAALAADGSGVPAEHRGVFGAMTAGHREAGTKRLIKRAIYLAALVGFVSWLASGGFTGLVLRALPIALDGVVGKSAAESIAEDQAVCDEEALVGVVEQILVRLVDSMDAPRYDFRVRVLRSPDVNAFALPGGEIFFYSGLLEKAESVHEVAAIMGHEVQHVLGRHGMRGMVRSAGIAAAVSFLFGDAGETAAVLAGYAGDLTHLKFGRDQEREADRSGVQLMRTAGFDPQGAVTFFGMLAEEAGDTGSTVDQLLAITSTHPASSERTERLRKMAAGGSTGGASRAFGDLDWSTVRGLCRPGGPATPAATAPEASP